MLMYRSSRRDHVRRINLLTIHVDLLRNWNRHIPHRLSISIPHLRLMRAIALTVPLTLLRLMLERLLLLYMLLHQIVVRRVAPVIVALLMLDGHIVELFRRHFRGVLLELRRDEIFERVIRLGDGVL